KKQNYNIRHDIETQNVSKRNNQEFLKTMYFNARSIRNKFQEIQAYVKSENLDIIGIIETWLSGTEFEAEFNTV
ncbi:hypothetical protein, partial [Stenotrophomonas sp. SY1]|uniref:hypothetical protein n=1 Tax=Stenotrophomonas sp. SY1 TaxID=477235 RepID=UPI001E2847AC